MPLPAGSPLPRTPAGGWGRARARAEAPRSPALPSHAEAFLIPEAASPPASAPTLPTPSSLTHSFWPPCCGRELPSPAPHQDHTSLHHPTLIDNSVCGAGVQASVRKNQPAPLLCHEALPGTLSDSPGPLDACGEGEKVTRKKEAVECPGPSGCRGPQMGK